MQMTWQGSEETPVGTQQLPDGEEADAKEGVKLAAVLHYLENTTTAPAGISVDRYSRGDGKRATRWRVLANGVASGDWMRTFGTQVDRTGNKMEWAAGWTRYRAEVEAARADQARWKQGSIHDMTRALIRAGKTAFGMMGGGEPHRKAPRDRILSDLMSIRSALAAVMTYASALFK